LRIRPKREGNEIPTKKGKNCSERLTGGGRRREEEGVHKGGGRERWPTFLRRYEVKKVGMDYNKKKNKQRANMKPGTL